MGISDRTLLSLHTRHSTLLPPPVTFFYIPTHTRDTLPPWALVDYLCTIRTGSTRPLFLSPGTRQSMQRIIWQQIGIDIPDDWEMLQYDRESREGRCAFGDRYQIRMELSWRQSEGTPDLKRSRSDYVAKAKRDGTIGEAEPVDAAGWYGLAGYLRDIYNSRFLGHLGILDYSVQVVFLWPEKRDTALEKRILGSIRAETIPNNGHTHWKTFGMELFPRKDLMLTTCVVQPAHAAMTFGFERSSVIEERYKRLGLVSYWLKGSHLDWLRLQAPRHTTIEWSDTERRGEHEIAMLSGTRPGHLPHSLVGKRRTYRAAAWICPADQRLYFVDTTTTGPAGETRNLPARKLRCCAKLAATGKGGGA